MKKFILVILGIIFISGVFALTITSDNNNLPKVVIPSERNISTININQTNVTNYLQNDSYIPFNNAQNNTNLNNKNITNIGTLSPRIVNTSILQSSDASIYIDPNMTPISTGKIFLNATSIQNTGAASSSLGNNFDCLVDMNGTSAYGDAICTMFSSKIITPSTQSGVYFPTYTGVLENIDLEGSGYAGATFALYGKKTNITVGGPFDFTYAATIGSTNQEVTINQLQFLGADFVNNLQTSNVWGSNMQSYIHDYTQPNFYNTSTSQNIVLHKNQLSWDSQSKAPFIYYYDNQVSNVYNISSDIVVDKIQIFDNIQRGNATGIWIDVYNNNGTNYAIIVNRGVSLLSTTWIQDNLTVSKDANITGNVSGKYFIGNGSLLTGICLANGTGCSAGMNYTNLALTNQSNTFTNNQTVNGAVNIYSISIFNDSNGGHIQSNTSILEVKNTNVLNANETGKNQFISTYNPGSGSQSSTTGNYFSSYIGMNNTAPGIGTAQNMVGNKFYSEVQAETGVNFNTANTVGTDFFNLINGNSGTGFQGAWAASFTGVRYGINYTGNLVTAAGFSATPMVTTVNFNMLTAASHTATGSSLVMNYNVNNSPNLLRGMSVSTVANNNTMTVNGDFNSYYGTLSTVAGSKLSGGAAIYNAFIGNVGSTFNTSLGSGKRLVGYNVDAPLWDGMNNREFDAFYTNVPNTNNTYSFRAEYAPTYFRNTTINGTLIIGDATPDGPGSANISGNLIVGGNFSAKRPYYNGYDNSTQAFISTTTAQVMNITNNADYDSWLINVTGNQNLTFKQTGDYVCILMPEFYQASGANKIISFWIQKNGVDVPWSNSRWTMGNGDYQAPSITYQFDIENPATDNIRFMWYSDSTASQIVSITGLTSPTRPSIPGVLLNCQKVSEITP